MGGGGKVSEFLSDSLALSDEGTDKSDGLAFLLPFQLQVQRDRYRSKEVQGGSQRMPAQGNNGQWLRGGATVARCGAQEPFKATPWPVGPQVSAVVSCRQASKDREAAFKHALGKLEPFSPQPPASKLATLS